MQYDSQIAALLAGTLARDAFGALNLSPTDLAASIKRPKDPKNGDLAFPCFRLSKQIRKTPPEIASALAETLTQEALVPIGISAVVAEGPFLNFFIARAELAATLIPSILDRSFTSPRTPVGKKVMVEYSQPNTHKAFHVGHLRNAALGDSITRLLEWTGHEVMPTNYIGDEGTHVAKCLWYMRTRFKGEVPSENRGEFLGDLYTKACELLSPDTLTEAPLPGVRAAKVLELKEHPSNAEWCVVKLEVAGGETPTVVVGVPAAAGGFAVGDLVAYASPGLRVAGKAVGVVDRGGVESTGMVLSESELFGKGPNTIATLPPTAGVGDQVAEVFRRPSVLPEEVGVLEEFSSRQKGVSEVLQAIESGTGDVWEQWKETKEWSMKEFRRIYDWMGARFDDYFYESEVGEESKALVRENLAKGVFVESQGAVVADLREFSWQGGDLGFCVLIKRDGTALYATRDLALARRKFEKFGVDRSLYVVDSSQSLHFQQVFKCLELMGYEQASKCVHVPYAQVVLPDGKMSSRKGNVILFSQLEAGLLENIHREFLSKYEGDWSGDEIENAGRRIAVATMRYGMLNQVHGSKIVFNLDAWTSKSGDTGPYMLCTYARIRSMLRELSVESSSEPIDWSLLKHETETDILAWLSDYPRAVERAAEQLLPQVLCVYVYELSRKFNRWYNLKECSVLHAESAALKAARLQLVDASGRVLKHALSLLGIETIDRM
uniref:arginine--tRNA ligase n=1 Tax=Chromera velia CCMP2878 TaxID=1169474 RepID=A0A0G4HLF1_9ALVE|eukprot:Cvel_7363.t1-p1 / transcript=Cvel_7363.t1 / gene=Cvel_7363 / organism=Chromera_velia_CCMP2878 / gene_product=Arginine--tRNA ligase, putative / transcript_product=Arginine--tRNA ligase, putative / location=Cvel_scaffold382:64024-66469(-) / protein_length=720 / sequence_SO=supercontig / SO=protein_coding / is_pseudo=false